ncbi:MAG: hypothetical protein HYS05_19155, partial [Acidobacteria bacterium]|nr:hypothetical protein [Acidobacteriota bacterium]
MTDREIIVALVTAVDRRLRRQEQARLLTRAFVWSLVVPFALTVAPLVAPVPAWLIVTALSTWIALLGSSAVWVWSRRRSLAQAAAEVDRRAALNNELTSALWFVEQHASSPWIDYHVGRAAGRAGRIDAEALLPWQWPEDVRTAGALVAVLLVVNGLMAIDLVPRSWTRAWLQAQLTSTSRALSEAERQTAREIQDLLEHAERLDPSVFTPEDRQLAREFAEIVRDLENNRLTSPEASERLARIRKALEALASLERAKAPLAARPRPATESDLKQLEEALRRALADAKSSAGERGEPGESDAADPDRARAEARADMREATVRRLKDMEKSMGGRSRSASGRQERGASEQNQSSSEPGAGQDDAQSSSQAPGQGQMQPMDGDGRQSGLQARGSLGGGSSGSSTLVGPKTSLQVKLRRELLSGQMPGDSPTGADREEPRNQETKEARSKLQFQQVAPRPRYARPDAMEPDQVPWPYRDLV